MSKKTRSDLKGEFQTGAIPTAGDFANLIDSALNLNDDGLTVDATNRISVGGTQPTARLSIQGGFDVALTGTLAAAPSTAANQVVAITGTGTKFTSELEVGQPLQLAAQVLTVSAITSDTQMTASRIQAGAALPAGPAFKRGAILDLRDAAAASQLFVGPGGHVGIGTVAPAARLEVHGTVLAERFRGDGSAVQGLDASNITAGVMDPARLPASAVSAPIDVSRIPPLDAARITSGTFDAARLPQTLTATNLIVAPAGAGGPNPAQSWSFLASGGGTPVILLMNGNQTGLRLEGTGKLSVSSLEVTSGDLKVTAGALSGNGAGLTNLAPANLSATVPPAKGGTGLNAPGSAGNFLRSNGTTWESSIITVQDLPASVVSGMINVSQIPPLDAARITSGTFDAARLPQTLTLTNLIVAPAGTGVPNPAQSWSFLASGGGTPVILLMNGNQTGLRLEGTGKLSVSSLEVTSGDLKVTAGVLTGNGAGLTNLAPANLSVAVPVTKGGTGLSAPGAAGNVLRSNGTSWESARLTGQDLPSVTGGSGSFIQDGTTAQANANFNIGGSGKAGSFDAAATFSIRGFWMLSIENNSVCVGRGQTSSPGPIGRGNTYVGNGSGASNTGGGNTFAGEGAGFHTTVEDSSTFVGISAGLFHQKGTQNCLLGAYTSLGENLSNATAIGAQAMVTQSYSLVLGCINGINSASAGTKVGIGVTAPGSLLTLNAETATEPALEISQGGIKVTGAGVNSHTCVFIHVVTAANIDSTSTASTLLDHPMTNGDNAAILMVTPQRAAGQSVPKGVYVDYDQPVGKWRISHLDGSGMNAGEHFNVLVFKV